MKRKDCAYCIDLDEQGALCDHPLHLDCGEPVEARCSSRCNDYERRIPIAEALSRIHDLEAKLAESEKWRSVYADMVIPLKVENAKLRELTKAAWGCVNRHVSCDACRMTCGGCTLQSAMRELGIEVKE